LTLVVDGSALVDLDRRLERWIVNHRVDVLDHVFVFLSRIGTLGICWLAIAFLLALVLRQPVLFGRVLLADVVAGALQYAIKRLVGRARPPERFPAIHPLVYVPSTPSFPSGHATAAFACAVVLARAAPRLTVPLVVLAALVAFSRDYVGVHYPLDSIAGAALGTAIGFALLRALPLLEAIPRRSPRSRRGA
jgi:undecaprenyl-diphosphatase